jgi:hypothetical protein
MPIVGAVLAGLFSRSIDVDARAELPKPAPNLP